jgi:hypothetical protein
MQRLLLSHFRLERAFDGFVRERILLAPTDKLSSPFLESAGFQNKQLPGNNTVSACHRLLSRHAWALALYGILLQQASAVVSNTLAAE